MNLGAYSLLHCVRSKLTPFLSVLVGGEVVEDVALDASPFIRHEDKEG